MNLAPLTLEKFGTQTAAPKTVLISREKLERLQQEAEERGRKAAQVLYETETAARRQNALSALTNAAGDMMFTHVDAKNTVMEALAPLLLGLLDKVLPEVARAQLPLLVVEQMALLAEQIEASHIHVHTASQNVEDLAEVIGGCTAAPGFELVADPELSPGQCRLVAPNAEIEMDLPALLDGFRTALADLNTPLKRNLSHAG